MKKCNDMISKIDDYVSNELTASEKNEISEHIKNCPDCKAELEFALSVKKALNNIDMPPVPANFLDRINNAIDEKPKKSRFPKMLVQRAATAVAACLVFAVVLSVNNKEELSEKIVNHDIQNTAGTFDNTIISKDIQNDTDFEEDAAQTQEPARQTAKSKTKQPQKNEENISVDTESVIKETPAPVDGNTISESKSAAGVPINDSAISNDDSVAESESVNIPDEESISSMSLSSCERSADGGGGGASNGFDADSADNQVRLMKEYTEAIETTYSLYAAAENIDTIKSVANKYGVENNGRYIMNGDKYMSFIAELNSLNLLFTAPDISDLSEITFDIVENSTK